MSDHVADRAGRSLVSRLGTWRRRRPWLALGLSQLLFLVALAPLVYYEAFIGFATYDDEGYAMLAVKHFIDGHTLYDEVWTLYGPVYYLYKWLVHGLGHLPITHDVVRSTAAVVRLAVGVVASLATFGLTRRVSLAAAVQVFATVYLTVIGNEPGHPQELAALLTMVLVALPTLVGSRGTCAVALGVVVGLLAMVKINLGVFAGIGVWMALVCATRRTGASVVLQIVSCLVVVLLPGLFMRRHLGIFWTSAFAATETATLLALSVLTVRRHGSGRVLDLGAYAASCVATVLVVTLGAMLTGSSLQALLECLLLSPVRMPGYFYKPFYAWSPWSGGIALALAALARVARRRPPESVVAVAKIAFGVFTLAAAWLWAAEALAGVAMPFVWLILLPPPDRERSAVDPWARLVLCWLAALTLLQAYPVGGSQITFGTVLLLVCAAVCFADAAHWLGARAEAFAGSSIRQATSALVVVALLGACVYSGRVAQRGYDELTPLDLPGAARIHLLPEEVTTYRALTTYLRENAQTVFSVPSFNSLYFWTGTEPPTLDVITHVMDFYSGQRQMAMLHALLAARKPLLVRSEGLADPPEGFAERLDHDFEPVAQFGRFQVLAPRATRGRRR